MRNFWLALRPKTLVAAFVPVLVAHCLSLREGLPTSTVISSLCLAGAFSLQIATNFFNDGVDFLKGADTEQRLGPKRMAQSGAMSVGRIWFFGGGFALLAFLIGIPLVIQGGWPIVVLGLFSLFLAYGYTGGPYPLAYLGLGDLFVVLFFGLFAVCGTFYLHNLSVSPVVFLAGLQIGFLATVLIAINNLRDSDTDGKVNKKTLAVRFGDKFVRWEIVFLICGAYGGLLLWPYGDWLFLPLLSLPVAGVLLQKIFKVSDKRQLNRCLALAGFLQLLFGSLLALGLVMS